MKTQMKSEKNPAGIPVHFLGQKVQVMKSSRFRSFGQHVLSFRMDLSSFDFFYSNKSDEEAHASNEDDSILVIYTACSERSHHNFGHRLKWQLKVFPVST